MPGFVPPGPRRQGFAFWGANECSHAHFNTQYFRDSPDPIPMKKFEAEGWTDIAVDFLKETKASGKPFFLTIAMGPPHDPYGAPPEYMKMYDEAKLTMRPNWKAGAANVLNDVTTDEGAFERIAAPYTPDERAALFAGTARRVYRV